jgi:hypothetical protein
MSGSECNGVRPEFSGQLSSIHGGPARANVAGGNVSSLGWLAGWSVLHGAARLLCYTATVVRATEPGSLDKDRDQT